MLLGPLDRVHTPGHGLAPALSAGCPALITSPAHLPSVPPPSLVVLVAVSPLFCHPPFLLRLHSFPRSQLSCHSWGITPTVPSTTGAGAFCEEGCHCMCPLPRQQQGSYLAIACPPCSSWPSSGLFVCLLGLPETRVKGTLHHPQCPKYLDGWWEPAVSCVNVIVTWEKLWFFRSRLGELVQWSVSKRVSGNSMQNCARGSWTWPSPASSRPQTPSSSRASRLPSSGCDRGPSAGSCSRGSQTRKRQQQRCDGGESMTAEGTPQSPRSGPPRGELNAPLRGRHWDLVVLCSHHLKNRASVLRQPWEPCRSSPGTVGPLVSPPAAAFVP